MAIDKSTPHRDTNQAIILIIPSNGKRVAVPVDAPIVYHVSPDSGNMHGGNHDELAQQVVTVLSAKLKIDQKQLHFLRGEALIIYFIFLCIYAQVKFFSRCSILGIQTYC